MFILPPEDIAGALCWLTTDAFESLRMPALAVVLAGPRDSDLLRHLEEQCRAIDRESESILILSLGSGREPPAYFNPLWSLSPRNELAFHISALRKKLTGNGRRYRPGTPWGTFTDAAVRLLDLEPSCLPAVYLRFAETSSGGPSPAAVVPLPRARDELASRFLKELSWQATDHAAGYQHLSAFLSDRHRFGWVISEETQVALDESFRAVSSRHRNNLASPHDSRERERATVALDLAITQSAGWEPSFSDIASEAERFFAPRGKRAPTAFNRPDLAFAIRLAAVAHREGDFGTAVRNLGAAIEAFFAASLLHLVRGAWSVRLPEHLDVVDPEAGPVEVNGVGLNNPRKELLGAPAAAAGLNPWHAPPLAAGTHAFESWLQDKAPPEVNRSSCAAIVSLLQQVAPLRNPAAHGDIVTAEQAKEAWQLFEDLILKGEAGAMTAIRDGFTRWPHTDWSVFSNILKDPRPHYDQALHDEREATRHCFEHQQVLESLRTKSRPWQMAIDDLSTVAQAANPSLKDLVTLPTAVAVNSDLPGWTEMKSHLSAATERERQAKALARSASSLFTTRTLSDRILLAEVSKTLTPDEEVIRTPADIDSVITQVEMILSLGKVIPISTTDWRPRIRTRLQHWLESRGADIATDGLVTAAAIRARAAAWTAVLRSQLHTLQPDIANAEALVANAQTIRNCAAARLQGARIGKQPPCLCGRHAS